jgi:hypothetical protein
MKRASIPFECGIAGKTVGITLRHGGGLQEPANVYVRCDERDCQYVDLNRPPCPLRIEMFADGSDRRVAAYLVAQTKVRFCYACLTEALTLTHEQVRRAAWQLKDAPGCSIRPSRCATCRRRRVTIGLAREASDATAPTHGSDDVTPVSPSSAAGDVEIPSIVAPGSSAVTRHLRASPGCWFCVHCLARDLKERVDLIRDVAAVLQSSDTFEVRTAQCVSCLLVKRTIRYEEHTSEVDVLRRVIHFLIASPGLAFCPSCVAFAADLALGDAKRILVQLEDVAEFPRSDAACSACGRWQRVIGAVGGAGADEADGVAVGSVVSGRICHRGFRVDLLSYRTRDGWRPFALVRTLHGPLVPDVPPVVLSLVSTKVEADTVARDRACEWIDKRFP